MKQIWINMLIVLWVLFIPGVFSFTSITTNAGSITDGELSVNSGDDITLICTVNKRNGADGTALWNGPSLGLAFDSILLHPDRTKYRISSQDSPDGANTQYVLEIRNVTFPDGGVYSCQNLGGELGPELQSVNISVLVYSFTSITTNYGSIRDGELLVNPGDDITLTCTVNKVDGADGRAYWSYNGTAGWVYLSRNAVLLHYDHQKYGILSQDSPDGSHTQYILEIRDVTIMDGGLYTCLNSISRETQSVNIRVPSAPSIYDITENQTAVVGDIVALACRAGGYPSPHMHWRHTRPNNRLPNGVEGEFRKDATLTLVGFNITSITIDDRGEYECIASNGEIEDIRTTFIRMEYEPEVEAITDGTTVVSIPVGDPASLTCKGMSYPRPSASDIIWYLNGHLIGLVDGYTFEATHEIPSEEADPYNETIYSTIRIGEVNSDTTEIYKCQFRNSRGVGSDTITLEIGEAPTFEAPTLEGDIERIFGTNSPVFGWGLTGTDPSSAFTMGNLEGLCQNFVSAQVSEDNLAQASTDDIKRRLMLLNIEKLEEEREKIELEKEVLMLKKQHLNRQLGN